MKIVFFELEEWEEIQILKALSHMSLIFIREPLTHTTLPIDHTDADAICTFIGSSIDASVINTFTHLKLILTRSTGYDHIDLKAAHAHNITVCYIPHYAQESVAEYTLALILSLTRAIPFSIKMATPSATFDRSAIRGIEISGKTIGIIGTGTIGSRVATLTKNLGMNVLGYDPHPQKYLTNQTIAYCSFNDLLKEADIISLHAPLNQKTYHMINRHSIQQIKKSAYLINTARGGLIETEALINALKNGIIKGAALDVFENEHLFFKQSLAQPTFNFSTHPSYAFLLNHPQVILTPHNAYNTYEALQQLTNATIKSIIAWEKGSPLHCVPD